MPFGVFTISAMDTNEIRDRYDAFARWYDVVESIPEWLGLRRLRRGLIGQARGRVLEVAAGTGRNLPFYPSGVQFTAVDLSSAMLSRARGRAARLGLAVQFSVQDGATLGFRDGSFDTVISTLTVCTFPDPVAALREMARVCRPGGQILLLEHGRSDRPWLSRWQDRRAPRHYRMLGCNLTREPLELARQAGLVIQSAHRHLLGMVFVIRAATV